MIGRNHWNVDIRISFKLFCRHNDLYRWYIVSLWDRVVQEANCTNGLSGRPEFILVAIAWIANDQWSSRCFVTTLDTSHFSIITEQNFITISVEHEGSTMNCAKSWEGLWKTSNTINWIQEWTVTISSLWWKIQLHLLYSVGSWLNEISVLILQCDCMTQEINGLLANSKVIENILHWSLLNIYTIPCFIIIKIDRIDIFV